MDGQSHLLLIREEAGPPDAQVSHPPFLLPIICSSMSSHPPFLLLPLIFSSSFLIPSTRFPFHHLPLFIFSSSSSILLSISSLLFTTSSPLLSFLILSSFHSSPTHLHLLPSSYPHLSTFSSCSLSLHHILLRLSIFSSHSGFPLPLPPLPPAVQQLGRRRPPGLQPGERGQLPGVVPAVQPAERQPLRPSHHRRRNSRSVCVCMRACLHVCVPSPGRWDQMGLPPCSVTERK